MGTIRWVCLSDMHFGAENSLLTELPAGSLEVDPAKPSPVLVALVECLRVVRAANPGDPPPTLVLNGDILELALAEDNVAAMAFDRFIDLAYTDPPVFADEIVYLPGNHDHHMWESARESQYAKYVDTVPVQDSIDPPWHATHLFPDPAGPGIEAQLLTSLVRRRPGPARRVQIAYPNLGLSSETGDRTVVFHHGHFVESLYRLMSTLRAEAFPRQRLGREVGDWESDNFAWIDFFWSSLGRSGEAGADVGLIYDMIQDPGALRVVVGNLAGAASQRVPRLLRPVAKGVLVAGLRYLAGHAGNRERLRTDAPLSADAEKGLNTYLTGPLLRQLRRERSDAVGSEVTFIFGHTHKPFQKVTAFDGYQKPVKLFNTGGWVVDTEHTAPLHGAAAVIIDEHLDVASLQFYRQTDDPSGARVTIDPGTGALAGQLRDTLDLTASPWTELSQVVYDEVLRRHQTLPKLIERGKSLATRTAR